MKLKKTLSLILIFAMLLTFASCSKKVVKEKYSNTFFDGFDTVITITAYCETESSFGELFKYSQESFLNYHKLYDIYNSYDGMTNLKDVNDRAGAEAIKVDREIINLLVYAKEMYQKTSGKMNVAMGAVLRLWHDAREDGGYIPSMDDLKEASLHCNIDDVVIDEANCTVKFNDPLLKLDVGAVAKGYATEMVAQELSKKGYTSVLINAGGNVKTTAAKPDGTGWVIGIQNPEIKGGEAYVEAISIEANSVVTSGVYERNFTVDGVTYHHIIDPNTLMPENNYLSVTIVTESSALADCLSTAVFNMSLEEGKAFIDKLDGAEAMWILNDKSYEFSSGFEKMINK